MNELNHTNGKGSVERSTRWRENYNDIDWRKNDPDGFKQYRTGKRKVYRRPLPASPTNEN